MQIRKISTDTVKSWIVWERWSAKTSNSAQSVLNIIMRTAKEKRLIKAVPSADLSSAKSKRSAARAFLVCAITGIGEVVGLQTFEVGEDRLNVEHSYIPVTL